MASLLDLEGKKVAMTMTREERILEGLEVLWADNPEMSFVGLLQSLFNEHFDLAQSEIDDEEVEEILNKAVTQ